MIEEHIDLVAGDGIENDAPYEEFMGLYTHNFEDSKEEMEDRIYRTLTEVMEDRNAKPADRIKAATEAAEILKLKGKDVKTTVIANNAQINNQLAQNPALAGDFSNISKGMKLLKDAKDSGIRSVKGGTGA